MNETTFAFAITLSFVAGMVCGWIIRGVLTR